MKIDTPPSSSSYHDDDKSDLEQLLDAFGSVVSLEDIASAYCQAGRNVCTAGEILCNMQGSTSGSTSVSKDELDGASASSEWSSDNCLEKSDAERYSTSSKSRKCSVSMGTVSGVIGREYTRHRPLTHESCEVTKPLKIISDELPVSEMWGEEVLPDITARSETMHKDVEEFLFRMLGDGFQLDMNIIREVLGSCGYDAKKSMEKLLDLSASTLEKSDNVSIIPTTQKPPEKCTGTESLFCQETSLYIDSTRKGKATTKKELELPKRDQDRYKLQKEVLEALFNVPGRLEEEPKRILASKKVRSRTFGQFVIEPLTDTVTGRRTVTLKSRVAENENDESYDDLRKAAEEYQKTMREYYNSSVDAFAKGNRVLADKLLEEGRFFRRKYREANEESAQKSLETRDEDEEMCLDFLDHEPKEAIRLLRTQLTSLSGIPSIRYLKLIIGTNGEDAKEVTRRRLIRKLLEKESITWTEDGNGWTMEIRMDKIDPKRLSFAKKSLQDYY